MKGKTCAISLAANPSPSTTTRWIPAFLLRLSVLRLKIQQWIPEGSVCWRRWGTRAHAPELRLGTWCAWAMRPVSTAPGATWQLRLKQSGTVQRRPHPNEARRAEMQLVRKEFGAAGNLHHGGGRAGKGESGADSSNVASFPRSNVDQRIKEDQNDSKTPGQICGKRSRFMRQYGVRHASSSWHFGCMKKSPAYCGCST